MTETATPDGTLTVSARVFKARCLELFEALEARKLARVIVTRRGRPVAEPVPSRDGPPFLWGRHRGSVAVAPGVNLTEPDEPPDAELGVSYC